MRVLTAMVLVLAVAGAGCRVPGRGKATGGKYRKCAKMGRGGEGSVKAGQVTCTFDDGQGSCTPDPGESLDLCIMAGVQDDAGTRENIDDFVTTCAAGGVDMLVVLGDGGSSAEQIRAVVDRLAVAGVPIGMIPGAHEGYRDYLDALDAARQEGVPVLDLSTLRVLNWGEVALVSMPGIRNPHYLAHPGEGCGYADGHLEDLGDLIEEASEERQVVVLAPQPPRCHGAHGVDVSREGTHVGDAVLRRVLLDRGGDLGVFAHVYEAGGAAVEPGSCAPLVQGQGQKGLWLNAGSIGSAPWEGEGGGVFSRGQAVVLQVAPEGARFFIWRAGAEIGK